MRNIFFALATCLCSISSIGMCQEEASTVIEAQPTSVQDLDYQIQLIQVQIEKFSGLALVFQSKAQRLQFQDFESSRHDAKTAEIFQGIANDLKERLKMVMDQKAKLLEKKPAPQNK